MGVFLWARYPCIIGLSSPSTQPIRAFEDAAGIWGPHLINAAPGFCSSGRASSSIFSKNLAGSQETKSPHYRGTPLFRNRTPLGPYYRPMSRLSWRSQGGGQFPMSEVPI